MSDGQSRLILRLEEMRSLLLSCLSCWEARVPRGATS